jgi:hypothetical protein
MNDLALKMKDETDARQGKMMQILVRCILRCSCWQNTLTMCVPYKEREREMESTAPCIHFRQPLYHYIYLSHDRKKQEKQHQRNCFSVAKCLNAPLDVTH